MGEDRTGKSSWRETVTLSWRRQVTNVEMDEGVGSDVCWCRVAFKRRVAGERGSMRNRNFSPSDHELTVFGLATTAPSLE